MTDLEKFLKECEDDSQDDCYECDNSMVRLQNKALASYCCRCDAAEEGAGVTFGWCKACETMEELDRIVRATD